MTSKLAAGVVLCCATLHGVAQQTVFRARTDLVQVDVVVTDRRGQPVTGLKAKDFTVVDGDRAQVVSQFREVVIPLAARTVDVGTPIGTVVDNGEPASDRALVVVIDTHHISTNAESIARLRRLLTDVLSAAVETDDIAVVFTGRSDLSVAFTRDLARHVAALDDIRDVLRPPAGNIRSRGFDLAASLWTVRNICSLLKGSHHARRAVLYVGEGLAVDLAAMANRRYLDEINATVEGAIRAGVVLYAIDPRGLVGISGHEDYEVLRQQRNFLSAMALGTGGRVLAGTAAMTDGVRSIMRENGSFYVLGYTPTPLRRDGAFHPLRITVRNPEWTVSARRGYIAESAEASGGRPETMDLVTEALAAPFQVRGVRLRASAFAESPASNGRIRVRIVASPAGASGGEWDVAFLALTPDGRKVAELRQRSTLLVDDGELTGVLDLPARHLALRVSVRDVAGGSVGSVHLPLEVPDLGGDRLVAGGLHIGPIESDRVHPVARSAFEASDTLGVQVPFFWRASDASAITVEVTLVRDGITVASMQRELDGVSNGERRTVTAVWRLDEFGQVAAGDYVVSLSGKVSGREVTTSRAFVIR